MDEKEKTVEVVLTSHDARSGATMSHSESMTVEDALEWALNGESILLWSGCPPLDHEQPIVLDDEPPWFFSSLTIVLAEGWNVAPVVPPAVKDRGEDDAFHVVITERQAGGGSMDATHDWWDTKSYDKDFPTLLEAVDFARKTISELADGVPPYNTKFWTAEGNFVCTVKITGMYGDAPCNIDVLGGETYAEKVRGISLDGDGDIVSSPEELAHLNAMIAKASGNEGQAPASADLDMFSPAEVARLGINDTGRI